MSHRRILLCATLFAVPLAARAATLLPLTTEDAATLSAGRTELILSAAYLRDERFPNFTPPDVLDRHQRVVGPQLGVRVGVGDWAEVQASFETLYVDESFKGGGGNSKFGAGDARLFSKMRIWRQQSWQPDVGLRFGAKLPNASFDDRLGTDETDFDIVVLASRDVPFGSLHCNLGISLLGNPGPTVAGDRSFQAGGQDDLFTWNLAYVAPLAMVREAYAVRAVAEFAGKTGSRFGNDRATFRVGAQVNRDAWGAFFGTTVGLDDTAEDYGFAVGISYAFSLQDLLRK